jgi:hypothetical protein
MDQTLRPVEEREIPRIIEKAALFGGKIAQSNPTSTIEIIIKRVDVDVYGTMTIKLLEEAQLERKRAISIVFNYRSLVFYLDSTQYVVKGDTIIADLPRGAKAIALRNDERYVLPLNSQVTGHVQRIEKRLETCPLDIKLVDVSQKGLGLIISNSMERSLLPNDHVWIKSIDNIPLKKPLFGRIVYTMIKKYKDHTIDIRAGVTLEEAIPDEVFTEIQKKCRLILTA